MTFSVIISGQKDRVLLPFALDGDERATLTGDIRHVVISALNKGYIIIVRSQADVRAVLNYFPVIEHPALEIEEGSEENIFIQFNMLTLSVLRP